MSNQIQLPECASYSYCAHSWRQQTNPLRKNFPLGWKCYKTIGSYISCAFIKIWSTWEVWRALKKLELLLALPQATLTHLSCSPNFLRASYLDEHMLTYEPIVECISYSTLKKNCTSYSKYLWFNFQHEGMLLMTLVPPTKYHSLTTQNLFDNPVWYNIAQNIAKNISSKSGITVPSLSHLLFEGICFLYQSRPLCQHCQILFKSI